MSELLYQARRAALQPKLDQIMWSVEREAGLVTNYWLGHCFMKLMPHRTDLYEKFHRWHIDPSVGPEVEYPEALTAMDEGAWAAWQKGDPVLDALKVTILQAIGSGRFTLHGRPSSDPSRLEQIPMAQLRQGRWAWWSGRIVLPTGFEWSDVQIKTAMKLSQSDIRDLRFADMRTWVEQYPEWVKPTDGGRFKKSVSWPYMYRALSLRGGFWAGIAMSTFEQMGRGKGVRYEGSGWRDADPRIDLGD